MMPRWKMIETLIGSILAADEFFKFGCVIYVF
jgi:hypothetical protein